MNKNIEKTDIELVLLVLKDPNNLKYIISRYEKRLYSYINNTFFFTRDDIEDILQDIFVKVYRNINSYDMEYKFSSWIYRIAHNEAVSVLRSRQHKQGKLSLSVDRDIFETFISDIDIESDFENSEIVSKISKCIEKLDKKYREILLLKYFEEKDYQEISDILHLSTGTVGSLLSRGKNKLKEIYNNERCN